MNKLLAKAARYRSSRGFGIHSPFAYDFVVNTLRQPLPYYVYGDITATTSGDGHLLRLLVRVLCNLRPATVITYGPLATEASRVVTLTLGRNAALSPARKGGEGMPGEAPEFLFADIKTCPLEEAKAVLDGGGSVMISLRDSGPATTLDELCCRGMSFVSRNTIIIVGRPDLPRQQYKVNF